MGNLLTLHFWFNMRPGSLTAGALNIFSLILVVLLGLGVFFKIIGGKKRSVYTRLWQRISLFGFSNFAIGLFLLFFAYELVPFLSMRFWSLLWLLEMIVWIVFMALHLREIPKIREKRAQEAEYRKYIP